MPTPALGPSFGVAPFGHMNVHVGLLIEIHVETQHGGTAAHHRHRGLNGLLHHFAQLARVRELALAGHHRGLDGQQLAADLGPRQTGHLTDTVAFLRLAVAEAAHAQILVEVFESTVTVFSAGVSSNCLTALRPIFDSSRSRLRTPASRV